VPIFNASFELPECNRAIPTTLVELYLPDKVIDGWVECTNAYAQVRAPVTNRKEVSKCDALRWNVAVQCMGVRKMPVKEDYFPVIRSDVLPVHPLVRINRYTFDYIWWYLHLMFKEADRFTFLKKKRQWKQKQKRTVKVLHYNLLD
jgi:hypothetical protein